MTFALIVFLFVAQAAPAPSAAAGIKLTRRFSSPGGIGNEQTLYIEGDRRRSEFRNATGSPTKPGGTIQVNYGPRLASIQRCDLGQMFELNLDDRQYVVAPYPPLPLTKEQMKARGLSTDFRLRYFSDKPTLKEEITTVDTGERKSFFGHTARHVITTRREIPLEGSPSQPSETVSDGWYIDLNTRLSCDRRPPSAGHTYAFIAAGDEPIERRTIVAEGKMETGFPIELKTTTRSSMVLPDGTKKPFTSINEMRVTDLEEKPLDPALFEVPSSFRKVNAIRRNPPASLSASVSTWAAIKQWFSNVLR
jgi:hypothetical protein